MMPMILTVYLNDGEQAVSEVPITPETTCRDVVEVCKEPGESGCHLAEVWRGNERAIPYDHMMFDHLQKWGPRKQEVKFYLRHQDSPAENTSDQGSQQSQDQSSRWSGSSSEKHSENGVGPTPRAELTLTELQEMATRQQQQIEAQQQMLVAKEQRLRYLKQQERKQAAVVTEGEKLQRLKERVENQEAKLKKIRAMRGQLDYSKIINGNLSAEIEHMSGLFQEKQAELQKAVLRVEQLSQQLEELRRGKVNGSTNTSSSTGKLSANGQLTGNAAIELRKLYQELQIRNKLNQEQNSKLLAQKELLSKRNMEVSMMDKRIGELRQRLYKKKAEARQKENVPLNRANGPPSPQPSPGSSGRVAAVGPYIQVPVPGRPEPGGYTLPPEPLKPQMIGGNSPANQTLPKSANDSTWSSVGKGSVSLKPPDRKDSVGDSGGKTPSPTSTPTDKGPDGSKPPPPISKPQPPPYGAHTSSHPSAGPPSVPSSSSSTTSLELRKDMPPPPALRPGPSASPSASSSSGPLPPPLPPLLGPGATNPLPPPLPAWPRTGPTPPQGSSSQQIQQRISVPPSPTFQPTSPLFPPALGPASAGAPCDRLDPPLAVAVRPFLPDRGSRPQSPRKGPATMHSSSIYHMYLQQGGPKNYPNKPAVRAVYGKPVIHSSSTPPSPLPFNQAGGHFPGLLLGGPGDDLPDGGYGYGYGGYPSEAELLAAAASGGGELALGFAPPPPLAVPSGVEHIPRPLSPTKLTPIVHSPLRYQSDVELEALRKKLVNAPRPLKKRSSITEPEGPAGPNIQKLLYQRFNTLAGGMEGGTGVPMAGMIMPQPPTTAAGTPFYQPATTGPSLGPAMGQGDADNGNMPAETLASGGSVAESTPVDTQTTLPQGDANDNQLTPGLPAGDGQCPGQPPVPPTSEEDNANNNTSSGGSGLQVPTGITLPSPLVEATTPEEAGTNLSSATEKRSNLRKPNSERAGHGLRVKFHPLALLLDSSLEGEFDLVQRIIYEVENPSQPNDEGITPLHNSVCAGHHHIVKFLLDFGVNVNAADSDGWTPLHCAASCNSVHLCKLLVESGAAIFATTISDVETAADKCEEMEEGYIQCSQFLYGVQEKLGVMNKGTVFALWEYEAQGPDELNFQEGDAITILRRTDDNETHWWWARLNDQEGYVPRNLLGLYPRIKPRQRSLA